MAQLAAIIAGQVAGNIGTSVLDFGHQYYNRALEESKLSQFGAINSRLLSQSGDVQSRILETGGKISGSLQEQAAGLQKGLISESARTSSQLFQNVLDVSGSKFEQAGLPSWLALTPSSASMFPRTAQSLGGQNYYVSRLPGVQTGAFTGNSSQSVLGLGMLSASQFG